MAGVIKYVVACACDGKIEPVAYIDDTRPTGGSLTVIAARADRGQIADSHPRSVDISVIFRIWPFRGRVVPIAID